MCTNEIGFCTTAGFPAIFKKRRHFITNWVQLLCPNFISWCFVILCYFRVILWCYLFFYLSLRHLCIYHYGCMALSIYLSLVTFARDYLSIYLPLRLYGIINIYLSLITFVRQYISVYPSIIISIDLFNITSLWQYLSIDLSIITSVWHYLSIDLSIIASFTSV